MYYFSRRIRMNDYQRKVLSIALSVSLLFNASCNKGTVVYNLPPEPIKSEEPKELKIKPKKIDEE